jgi:hypothetical protein
MKDLGLNVFDSALTKFSNTSANNHTYEIL